MDQARVGVVENSGFNLEVDLTDFAHGVDGRQESRMMPKMLA